MDVALHASRVSTVSFNLCPTFVIINHFSITVPCDMAVLCPKSDACRTVAFCMQNQIDDASAESSEKGDFLLSTNVVAHQMTVSLGHASDLHIPRSRGQCCQEAMATAAMTRFGDGILPSEWSGSGSGCRDVASGGDVDVRREMMDKSIDVKRYRDGGLI